MEHAALCPFNHVDAKIRLGFRQTDIAFSQLARQLIKRSEVLI